MQQVMSMIKKELMTGMIEAEMAVRIFCRERSRPKMRMACVQENGGGVTGKGVRKGSK
jgi:hypothetical protein